MIPLDHVIGLSAILFMLGVIGALTRRNLIIMFLCTELMFQAAGIALVAFSRHHLNMDGQTFVIFPEVDIEKMDKVPGMNVCIHTTAKTDDEGRALLTHLGMPFRAA